jgi:ketopantoate reductase
MPFETAVEDVLAMGRKFIAEGMDSYKVAMLLDLKNRRRTEIDNTAGVIVRKGQRAGIEVPYTEFVWRLIRGIESTFM